jgi:voltage-gated potassium channel Kch
MSAITVLLHGNDRLCGAIEQHLAAAGCQVHRLQLQDDPTGLDPGDLRLASILVLAANDDAGNVDLALTARRLRADLPLVVRVFEEPLAVYLKRTLTGVTTLSMSGLAAPAFAEAAVRAIAARSTADQSARPAVVGRLSLADRRARPDKVVVAATGGFILVLLTFTLFFATALNLSYLDALYFVWTTVTTVGYGDFALRDASAAAKVVGMAMMFAGAAFIALFFGLFTDWVVWRRLEILRGRVSVGGSGHVVIAGAGNIGLRVASRLRDEGHRVVIIERDADNKNIDALRSTGHHVILADAARADTLVLARAAHASAVVCLTDSDGVNFQIALLVHAQNADVPVIIRVASPELSAHVSERGDAIAISPTAIAGKEFSAAAVRAASR